MASALYPLVKKYFDTGKTLDETFVKEFVKAFDRLYPDGYTNPNLCLYDFCLIHSDDIKEHDLMFALSEKTTVAAFDAISFSNLKNDVLSAFQKKDNTLLVIFNENKELDKIRHIIPKFNDKNIVNIIHENGRTYIFLRTNKNSLKDTINKLFEK